MRKKLFALLTAGIMIGSLIAPTSAMAATAYTPVAGTSCNFNKYLIMDAGDNVPNVTFSFTVAAGEARSADTHDNTVMDIIPGVGTPTIADVTFSPSDTTTTEAGGNIDVARPASARANGLTAATGVELEPGEKYATKQATVDFSGITYNETGIYRYVISETANATDEAAGIMHDNDADRILDVYVTDDGNGTLVVSAYVLHIDDDDIVINNTMGSADVAAAGAALDDKTDGFTNEDNSKDLVFKKEVTGNQASRDKYFKFTVKADNINDADVFTVSIADDNDSNTTDGNADATSGTTTKTIAAYRNQTNAQEVTGAQLKEGVPYYLQHGQSIAIRGLAPNATYEVTEDPEDYLMAPANIDGNGAVEGYTDPVATKSTDAAKQTIGIVAGDNKAVKTSYLNEKSGIVPTGRFEHARYAIAATVIGAFVIAVFVFAKKRFVKS